jgi:hypothetical protein
MCDSNTSADLGDRGGEPPGGETMSVEQQVRVVGLVSNLAWGSLDDELRDMELALRLALEATQEAFWMWEESAVDEGFEDDFGLTTDQVRDLSPDWRLAYVACLLRSLGLAYGVGTELGGGPLVGEASSGTLAMLLRGLNDISWMPTTTERELP